MSKIISDEERDRIIDKYFAMEYPNEAYGVNGSVAKLVIEAQQDSSDREWAEAGDFLLSGYTTSLAYEVAKQFWQALKQKVTGKRLCARCGAIRTDNIDSDICGSCADDLRG